MIINPAALESDLREYVAQQPEMQEFKARLLALTEEGERLALRLTLQGVKTLISDIPVVGGVVEALTAPALDAGEAKVEAAAVAATEAEAKKLENP